MYCVARGKIRDRNSSEEPMKTWLMEQDRQRVARESAGFSVSWYQLEGEAEATGNSQGLFRLWWGVTDFCQACSHRTHTGGGCVSQAPVAFGVWHCSVLQTLNILNRKHKNQNVVWLITVTYFDSPFQVDSKSACAYMSRMCACTQCCSCFGCKCICSFYCAGFLTQYRFSALKSPSPPRNSPFRIHFGLAHCTQTFQWDWLLVSN